MEYVCTVCGVYNCKLWRDYNTICTRLLCCTCAAANEDKKISNIDADGRWSEPDDHQKTDQIGWMVPAVPIQDMPGAYYSYFSVPDHAVEWWRKLPTR